MWSNCSSHLPELLGWCGALARRIETDRMPLTGGGLDHLSAGEEIDRLPPSIFCVDWDSRVYKSPPRVRFRQGNVDVVYDDHGSGEVADFLAVTQRDGYVIVELFHCKGAGGGGAADRVDDTYEVCGQAVKSVIHADPALLLHRIEGRWHRCAGTCKFVKGNVEAFRRILQSHSRATTQFEIVVVQPGIARDRLSSKLANLLAATNDHLVRGGFSPLRVIGS